MIFASPKNFKSGRLIAGKYTWKDLLLLSSGILLTFILEIVFLINFLGKNKFVALFVAILLLIPALIALILVQPFGIYHNILTYIRIFILYFKRPKKYIWGGLKRNGTIQQEEES